MGDNYAEVLNHIFECPEAAWFLTANDDQGGGTYQVIEALRDRIDVVVQALAFNPRFLADLLTRIEENVRPEEVVPRDIVFSEVEVDRMQEDIRAVGKWVRSKTAARVSLPASSSSARWPPTDSRYKTKDTVRLSGVEWQTIPAADTGRGSIEGLGLPKRNKWALGSGSHDLDSLREGARLFSR